MRDKESAPNGDLAIFSDGADLRRLASQTERITRQANRVLKESDAASLKFLKAEVETCLTFVRIAEDSKDATKRLRNSRNARRAFDSVEHYFPAANLDAQLLQPVRKKMDALREKLVLLGEQF